MFQHSVNYYSKGKEVDGLGFFYGQTELTNRCFNAYEANNAVFHIDGQTSAYNSDGVDEICLFDSAPCVVDLVNVF